MLTRPLMLGAMLGFLSLSACSSAPVIKSVPVEVERFRYLPIPAALLLDCPSHIGRLETNGDLLDAYLEEKRAREECEGRLRAIGELKP